MSHSRRRSAPGLRTDLVTCAATPSWPAR
jgi:hypothetical protein